MWWFWRFAATAKTWEKPEVAAAGMELAQLCRPGAAGFFSHNVPHVAVVTQLEIQLLSSVVSPRSSRGKKKGCCYRKSFCRVYNVFREHERRRSRRTGTFDHRVAGGGGGRGGEGGGSTSGFFSCSCEKEEAFWGSASWGNYRVGSPLWNASDPGFVVRAQEKFSDAAADSSSLSRTVSNSSERSALFYEEEYADSSWNGNGSEREPEDEGSLNGNGSLRGEEESEGSIQRELSGTVSPSSSSPGSAADSVATGGKGPVYQVSGNSKLL